MCDSGDVIDSLSESSDWSVSMSGDCSIAMSSDFFGLPFGFVGAS